MLFKMLFKKKSIDNEIQEIEQIESIKDELTDQLANDETLTYFDENNTKEMTLKKIIDETPFLKKYVYDEHVTDINFDGIQLFYKHNKKGLLKAEIQPTLKEVERFIKQIANETNKEFNNSSPTMDTAIGFLRISAVHEVHSLDGASLNIRIARPKLISSILDMTRSKSVSVQKLLEIFMQAELNTIIAGRTGTGKTELQKHMAGFIQQNKSSIVVEDTRDSHIKKLYPNLNIISWLVTDNNTDNPNLMDMSKAVKVGMRNNPDWLIIAETRGKESADMLDAAKTDHAIVSSLHVKRAKNIPSRMISMVRSSPAYSNISDLIVGKEIVEFFPIGIYLEYDYDEEAHEIIRYISEIVIFTDYTKEGTEFKTVYKVNNDYNEKTGEYVLYEEYDALPEFILQHLKNRRIYHLLPDIFKKGAILHEENNKAV